MLCWRPFLFICPTSDSAHPLSGASFPGGPAPVGRRGLPAGHEEEAVYDDADAGGSSAFLFSLFCVCVCFLHSDYRRFSHRAPEGLYADLPASSGAGGGYDENPYGDASSGYHNEDTAYGEVTPTQVGWVCMLWD